MASRFAYVQARISHGVKCLFRFLAEPHMHSCWLNKPRHPQLCQQDSKKKNQIPACLWDKYLSIFACPGQVLVCSFNDLVGRWLSRSLAHEKLLAQKENLLVVDDGTELFLSSPDKGNVMCFICTSRSGSCESEQQLLLHSTVIDAVLTSASKLFLGITDCFSCW